ncbi:hypothetical protein Nepgr_003161 [Nepenthes gracilis]|uniref:Uncharacterized protein n=1 Tax=Nepenthes gracilis TaxID=150966 RepID=A0AAD3RZ45_NEPGR|nr:hypothetical protein Nepgr_003161 [Nepenthes gracilis]
MSTVPDGIKSGTGEIMLFGVRVVVDSMRKSVSLNNLSQYEHPLELSNIEKDVGSGYVSADNAVHGSSSSASNRERKRGVPWTEEEHKLFLIGLQKVGKGDWRGISRNFVKTRTPTQVASHAQKYFLRRNNLCRRRRRSSLFDITTDSVVVNLTNEQLVNQTDISQSPPAVSMPATPAEISNIRLPGAVLPPETSRFSTVPVFPYSTSPVVLPAAGHDTNVMDGDWDCENENVNGMPVPPVSPATTRTLMVGFDLNQSTAIDPPLSLKLSLSLPEEDMPNYQASIMGLA